LTGTDAGAKIETVRPAIFRDAFDVAAPAETPHRARQQTISEDQAAIRKNSIEPHPSFQRLLHKMNKAQS
jgi:hypothetical protein